MVYIEYLVNMNITNKDNLKHTIEVINTQIIHNLGGPLEIYNAASSWFISKTQSYAGPELLTQLERNFVYFAEAVGCSISVATQVLRTGEPKVSEEQLDNFIAHVGKTLPLQQADVTMDFLHNYSNSLSNSRAKVDWRDIRKLKESPNSEAYLTFLANEAVGYYMSTILADIHLRVYLFEDHLGGSCKTLQAGVINDTLYTYIVGSCQAMRYYFPEVMKNL